MAVSRFKSEQYTSDAFVESAGAILVRLSSREICVLHLLDRDEYVLAKGRGNCGEPRQETTLREVAEEMGFSCRLQSGVCEPFTLQVRHLVEGEIKLIWWYVAAIDEEKPPGEVPRGEGYAVEFYSYAEVLDRLTFLMDHEMVERAVELVENTYGERSRGEE